MALAVKNSCANAEDVREAGSIPESRRSPEEGNGNPLQYSCLGNPWTEQLGGLQSIGSRRVRHDGAHTIGKEGRITEFKICLELGLTPGNNILI